MPDALDPEVEAQARAALAEIAPAGTIGSFLERTEAAEGVFTLTFATNWSAYPGWVWTITLARVGEGDPLTVVEHELLPGNGALLAPDWVPWSVRLAEFKAQEAADRAAASDEDIVDESNEAVADDDFAGDADDDDFDDEDDDDEDDGDDDEDEDEFDDDLDEAAEVDDLIDDDDELIEVEEELEEEDSEDDDIDADADFDADPDAFDNRTR